MKHYAKRDDEIERIARQVRTALGIDHQTRPNIIDVLSGLKNLGHIVNWVVRDKISHPDDFYNSDQRILYISERTYKALQDGDARTRWTIAHELGHAILGHTGRNCRKSPAFRNQRIKQSIEAEADRFAAALLAPAHLIDASSTTTAEELVAQFGITDAAAQIRLEELRRRKRAVVTVRRDVHEEKNVQRAGELRFASIRETLERDYFGSYVMINTETAEYVVAATTSEVHAKFLERFGETAPGWCTRIGASVFASA